MSAAVRWQQGEAELCGALDAALAPGAGGAVPLEDNPRRRILRVETPKGPVLVKQFRTASGRHPWRERAKARIGRAPAAREWAALRALRAASLPVPTPLALGTLPGGDRLLAMEWVEGQPLPDALHGGGAARRALARALGETLRRVHEAGWVHGDCHAGNVRVAEAGPVLLDWQHARRTRRGRSRRRDLAHLEHSLAAHVPIGARLRVREAALARPRPWGAAARRALRGAGREADARTREHARSRTRHVLRPGRRAAALQLDGFQGLRLRELPEATLRAVLAEHRQCLAAPDDPRRLERDARSSITAHAANDWHVVVKATPWRGLPRALGDALRGSAGRRAWRGGHGLLARGVGAARPLAFAERRRLGLPVCSWVLLEDQRPAPEAAFAVTRGEVTPDELLDVLLRLLLALHRAGIEHGDLKGTHVLLQRRATRLEPTLIDLEGVRFPGRLEDRQRLRALAQLNASLPDDVPDAARRRAFERYARALPFRMPRERALRELVARSLERRHRWTGAGCAAAQSVRTASHWK